MKRLYEFTINKKEMVKEPVIEKNEKGEEIEVLKQVEKNVPLTYFIAKPTRSLGESADLFYHSIFWKCVDMGIKSAPLLQKRYLNDGGVLSDDQKKEYETYYNALFEKQAAYRSLNAIKEKSENQVKESEKILNEITDLLAQIQTFEDKGNQLYQNTAETIARNRTALWWMLNLSYKVENDKEVPVFGAGLYEEKLKIYDALEDREDPFEYELVQKLLLITSLWYNGRAQTKEDFDILMKYQENQGLIETVEKVLDANATIDEQPDEPQKTKKTNKSHKKEPKESKETERDEVADFISDTN